jgi:serine/threonine protein kinase
MALLLLHLLLQLFLLSLLPDAPAADAAAGGCCPAIAASTLPGLARGAAWDVSNFYQFSRNNRGNASSGHCDAAALDAAEGCASQGNAFDDNRVYCSADLMYVRVPGGLLRGCCSEILALEFNGVALDQKSGGAPGPFVSCATGQSCDFAASCDNECDLLSVDRFAIDGVAGGMDVLRAWNGMRDLAQKQSWLTIKGKGFVDSKQCLKDSLNSNSNDDDDDDDNDSIMSALRGSAGGGAQEQLAAAAAAAAASAAVEIDFACARLIVSSFPRSSCPGGLADACSGHGECLCNSNAATPPGQRPDPKDFAPTCTCHATYFGSNCDTFCPKEHGTWIPPSSSSGPDSKGTCACATGWHGLGCQDQCVHGVYNRSAAAAPAGQTCRCEPGYEGHACNAALPCWGAGVKTRCNGHGLCSNGTTCVCRQGWTGDACEDAPKASYEDRGIAIDVLIFAVAGAFFLGACTFLVAKPLVRHFGSSRSRGGGHRDQPPLSASDEMFLHEPFLKLNGLAVAAATTTNAATPPPSPWEDNFLMDASRLKLGQKIGGGTSGEVFLASYDGATTVAAKKLFSPVANAAAFDMSFRREVALLSQLNHPNVVQLLGVCYDDHWNCVIVTELCVGSLREIIDSQRGSPMPSELAANMVLQIASGMLYLHERNVIHRDLKPANCLLTGATPGAVLHPGASFTVKICDFGLSRVKQSDMTMTEMTAEVGTPAYMAPELVSEESTVIDTVDAGKAVDIYSFALTALEIFTCVRPYSDIPLNNAFHLMMKVSAGLRPTIPQVRGGSGGRSQDDKEEPSQIVPLAVEEIIRGCWTKVPQERPPFSNIVERLQAYVAEVRRRRLQMRAAAAAGGEKDDDEEEEEEDDEEEERRSRRSRRSEEGPSGVEERKG